MDINGLRNSAGEVSKIGGRARAAEAAIMVALAAAACDIPRTQSNGDKK